jgi:hypothetical protein
VRSGDFLLSFGNEDAVADFDVVGVAHPVADLRVIENDLGLRPVDVAVALHAAAHPDRVAVVVGAAFPAGGLSQHLAAVEAEPVKVLAVGKASHEVRAARVLHPPAPGRVGHPVGLPGVPVVAAVGVARVAVDRAVRAVQRTIVHRRGVEFAGHGPAAFGGAQTHVAIGQRLPGVPGSDRARSAGCPRRTARLRCS